MIKYVNAMYPFWSFLTAVLLAQLIKPFFYFLRKGEWNFTLFYASGRFPSSHSSGVSALALAVGLQDGFSSSIFAVTLAFACVVIYDAGNVRYYAGKNIEITQQLIKDIQLLTKTRLEDPVYLTHLKDVLGHKWIEIIGGIGLGLLVALILNIL
ncbi:MAG: divergent PAP2 family protein [Anaerorhabdus sp.]